MKQRLTYLILGLAFSTLGGCNYSIDKVPVLTPTASVDESDFKRLQREIFNPKCARCHHPGKKTDLTSHTSLVQRGLIVPGNATASLIYEVLVREKKAHAAWQTTFRRREKLVYDWLEAGGGE